VTLAVPLAGLLALAAEQHVASLGGLRKRGPYNSPLSITLLPTPTVFILFLIIDREIECSTERGFGSMWSNPLCDTLVTYMTKYCVKMVLRSRNVDPIV